MGRFLDSFMDSNRWKHFFCAIPLGFLFTFLFAAGAGFGMEFKDSQWGGQFDWVDFLFTCLGGLVGQGLQLFVIYLFLNY